MLFLTFVFLLKCFCIFLSFLAANGTGWWTPKSESGRDQWSEREGTSLREQTVHGSTFFALPALAEKIAPLFRFSCLLIIQPYLTFLFYYPMYTLKKYSDNILKLHSHTHTKKRCNAEKNEIKNFILHRHIKVRAHGHRPCVGNSIIFI